MAWNWRYFGPDGEEVEQDLPTESFTSRGDAESWLGENWQELADRGVGRVALMEEDRRVYAMSLEPTD